jgi:hypothetical protein
LDNFVDDIAKCEEMFAENPFKEPALDALRRAWKEMYDACIKAGCKNCDRDKDDGGDRPPGPELVPVG